MGVFTQMSGLDTLVKRYPATEPSQGTRLDKQTVQIGPVRYRRCVTVQIDDAGLTLWVRPPLGRHLAIRIPWSELVPRSETRIYWARAMLLSVGQPEIATLRVQMGLYERLRPYLDGAGPRA